MTPELIKALEDQAAMANTAKDLQGALVRVVLEGEGCGPDCTKEFHRWAIDSMIKIARDALKRLHRSTAAPDANNAAPLRRNGPTRRVLVSPAVYRMLKASGADMRHYTSSARETPNAPALKGAVQ